MPPVVDFCRYFAILRFMSEKQRVTISVNQETISLMAAMGIDVTGNKLGRQCSAIVAKSMHTKAQDLGLLPGDIPAFSTDPKVLAQQVDGLLKDIVGLHRQLEQKTALAQSLSQRLAQ